MPSKKNASEQEINSLRHTSLLGRYISIFFVNAVMPAKRATSHSRYFMEEGILISFAKNETILWCYRTDKWKQCRIERNFSLAVSISTSLVLVQSLW